jgi:hypothetical protein
MNERRLCLPERRKEPTDRSQIERTIVPNPGYLEPDLVHMSDEHDRRLSAADRHPEIPRTIGLTAQATGQALLDLSSDRRFHPGHTVALDQAAENPLGLTRRQLLSGHTLGDQRRGYGTTEQQSNGDSHSSPPIQRNSDSRSESASVNDTVSTAVPANLTGRDHSSTRPRDFGRLVVSDPVRRRMDPSVPDFPSTIKV